MKGVTNPRIRNSVPTLPFVAATTAAVGSAKPMKSAVASGWLRHAGTIPNGNAAISRYQMMCSGRNASSLRDRISHGHGVTAKDTAARVTKRAASAPVSCRSHPAGVAACT
jgi:hypothetical protein